MKAKCTLLIRSVSALCLALSINTAQAVLVGHWTFDNQDLTETSGFTAAGTHDGLAGGAGTIGYDVGATGSGFSLDLTDADTYAVINNTSSSDAGYLGTFDNAGLGSGMTFAFWAEGVPGRWAPFISKHGEGSTGYQLRKNNRGPNFSWTMRGAGGGDTNQGEITSGWQHFAATWDGTERRLYIDGALVGAYAGPTDFGDPINDSLVFGGRQQNGDGSTGAISALKLDDVRIYNTRLTIEELAAENIDGVTFVLPDPPAPTALYKALQFDVGAGAGDYTGNETPAHASGVLPGGDVTFNHVTGDKVGDATNGAFKHTDGTIAAEITVDFGRQTAGDGTGPIDWNVAPNSTSNDSGSGVEDTGLMEDWLFTGGENNLGVRVSGLAPGLYEMYALVREPNAQERTYDVGIGVDTDDTTEIGDLIVQAIGDASANNGAAWVDGLNYVSQTITINSTSDWATIIVDPTNAAYGTLEGFQIVPVPEPSSMVILALGGALALGLRRKA